MLPVDKISTTGKSVRILAKNYGSKNLNYVNLEVKINKDCLSKQLLMRNTLIAFWWWLFHSRTTENRVNKVHERFSKLL